MKISNRMIAERLKAKGYDQGRLTIKQANEAYTELRQEKTKMGPYRTGLIAQELRKLVDCG